MGQFVPCLIRHHREGRLVSITLGHPLLDDYLTFVAVRARTNTWLAVASDLRIFFATVGKAQERLEHIPSRRGAELCDRDLWRLRTGVSWLAAPKRR